MYILCTIATFTYPLLFLVIIDLSGELSTSCMVFFSSIDYQDHKTSASEEKGILTLLDLHILLLFIVRRICAVGVQLEPGRFFLVGNRLWNHRSLLILTPPFSPHLSPSLLPSFAPYPIAKNSNLETVLSLFSPRPLPCLTTHLSPSLLPSFYFAP